jgi:hypothetical protein
VCRAKPVDRKLQAHPKPQRERQRREREEREIERDREEARHAGGHALGYMGGADQVGSSQGLVAFGHPTQP